MLLNRIECVYLLVTCERIVVWHEKLDIVEDYQVLFVKKSRLLSLAAGKLNLAQGLETGGNC